MVLYIRIDNYMYTQSLTVSCIVQANNRMWLYFTMRETCCPTTLLIFEFTLFEVVFGVVEYLHKFYICLSIDMHRYTFMYTTVYNTEEVICRYQVYIKLL